MIVLFIILIIVYGFIQSYYFFSGQSGPQVHEENKRLREEIERLQGRK